MILLNSKTKSKIYRNKKSTDKTADSLTRRAVELNHILIKNSQGISLESQPCDNTLHLSPQIYNNKEEMFFQIIKNNPKKILGLFSRIPECSFSKLIPELSIANHRAMSIVA